MGLASIRQAVEHYHGQMEITDKDNEFQVVVILYGADSNAQPTT
ncbi:GHKL domain-containing protein [Agathobacter rectalis]|uniref:GHKL domain-containing protein n=1 Tax=Agathobacter rectalis TaxID=39491 RepID=A0A412Q1G0_9FIRM|nr:GHKL domain-containing protein [Agathobacter rectalis]RGT79821.1 GHKL domain-containing protein [Agathobacter rectalis]